MIRMEMKNARRVVLTACLGVTTTAGLALTGQPAEAATLCVGTGSGCYATIQAAVNAAHDGDRIAIGPGTYAGGITVDVSVQLAGAGPATTISGGGPVVTIGSATATPTVTIANLTITGGVTTTDPQSPKCGPDVPTCGPGYPSATALGGGVEAFPGTTVTILHSVVTGNRAMPSKSVPSVKAVCPGNVPCPASFGDAAGIDDWGTMTLTGTVVSDNHGSADQSNGGGIAVEAGASLSLNASAVTGNSASAAPPTGRFASGGGIFVDTGGTLAVNNSKIDGNIASIANTLPSPYPKQTGATDNENAFTGGIFLADGSTATISNSELDGNSVQVNTPLGQAFGADAALCACGNAPLTIQNSRIEGNSVSVHALSSDANGPSGGAVEADANAALTNVRIAGNTITVNSPSQDAAAIGAVGLFFGGTVTPTITNTAITGNTATANAPNGTATVQGAGITNNGPLVLTNVAVSRNRGIANGQNGSAQGAGIWNGVLFGGPASPLTLRNSKVTGNALSGGPGITLQGGGIFTPGFPTTLTNSIVARNTPDQCFGC